MHIVKSDSSSYGCQDKLELICVRTCRIYFESRGRGVMQPIICVCQSHVLVRMRLGLHL